MSSKRPIDQAPPASAIPVRLRPIDRMDLLLVQLMMAEIAPDWSVELQGICADEASLLLLPKDGDDAFGPSFIISRELHGLQIDQVHWDVITEVGIFASLTEVLDALRQIPAFRVACPAPLSYTVH